MAVRTGDNAVAHTVATIAENGWVDIDYTDDGIAQLAECLYGCRWLILRRTRLTDAAPRLPCSPTGVITPPDDLDGPNADIDRFHRCHATVELALRDVKDGAGLDHCPSGAFNANGAWLACSVLAHNLLRWTALSASCIQSIS
jgi:hypothetical protein